MSALIIILALIAFFVFFAPTFIAFNREHHYKWIIFGINLIFGVTGIGYLVAFAWAVWPRQTAIADIVRNDPTDNSLEACKQYYQKRGEIDRTYDQARQGNPQSFPPQQTVPVQQPNTHNATDRSTKSCPFCGEEINVRAIKCKHCQSMLNA